MYFKDFDKCQSSEPAAISFPKNMKNRPETVPAYFPKCFVQLLKFWFASLTSAGYWQSFRFCCVHQQWFASQMTVFPSGEK